MGTKNRKLHIGHISLKEKLFILCAFLIIPFSIIIFYLLYNLNQYCSSYDSIVRNITQANEYNVAFKEDMDEVVYQMIARSMSKYEVESQLNMKNPDRMITDAEQTFESLKQNSFSPDAQDRLSSVIKLLITLRKRVNDIDSKVKISGYYDENMTSLDSDIRIITELIQERISEYIYHESESMETVRQNMSESRNILTRFSFMTIGTTLALVILLSIFISRSITEPIKRLTAVTKQVGKGDFSTRSEVNEGDDLAALNRNFNSMVERIGTLVENNRKEQERSRELELKLLQAQINPHFLYNTLDNIVWLTEDGKKEEVESLVTSLSQFFRTTLSGGRDFIRLKEEISHIESYLQIQKFRYSDVLSYEISMPEELGNYSIVKMTLQPIVENALYHGLKNRREIGKIRIAAEEMDDGIRITVADDGIGMTGEELEKLRQLISGEIRAGENNTGFGMANVAERLKLNYGKNYGLTIESEYGKGTTVRVLIPKRIAEQ